MESTLAASGTPPLLLWDCNGTREIRLRLLEQRKSKLSQVCRRCGGKQAWRRQPPSRWKTAIRKRWSGA